MVEDAVRRVARIGLDLDARDLRGADLRNQVFSGASLRRSDLEGALLQGASLDFADLRGANLEGARLDGADLRGASLGGADLRGTQPRAADLWASTFDSGTRWDEGTDLRQLPTFDLGPSFPELLRAFWRFGHARGLALWADVYHDVPIYQMTRRAGLSRKLLQIIVADGTIAFSLRILGLVGTLSRESRSPLWYAFAKLPRDAGSGEFLEVVQRGWEKLEAAS
ncbi:MAG TPA: pentapeptide repeat-containing protein [Armatimonadota bacterium]|nr:pentapeptide repeat-containing protein [Armatimonadota bacterium]